MGRESPPPPAMKSQKIPAQREDWREWIEGGGGGEAKWGGILSLSRSNYWIALHFEIYLPLEIYPILPSPSGNADSLLNAYWETKLLWKLTCLSRVSCDNEGEKVRRRRWSNSSLLFKYTSSNELSPGRWTPRDFFLDWFSLIGINDEISIFKRSTVRFRSILLKIGNLDRARTAILIWRAINAICMGNKDIGRRGVPTIRCP